MPNQAHAIHPSPRFSFAFSSSITLLRTLHLPTYLRSHNERKGDHKERQYIDSRAASNIVKRCFFRAMFSVCFNVNGRIHLMHMEGRSFKPWLVVKTNISVSVASFLHGQNARIIY